MLGIESTAHSFGVSLVRSSGRAVTVLSNEVAKYPSSKSGYLPRKLADFHAEKFPLVLGSALVKADVSVFDVDAVAFSRGPGIGHCLQAGFTAAKALSLFLSVPLVPVNHAFAHAEVVRVFSKAKDPLVVYVSGGNTQIFCKQNGFFHVLGETLDVGIGNFLDNLGRLLNLNPPDAVGVLKNAQKGRKLVSLPYVVKGMNTSYSGMLTYVEKLVGKEKAEDLCFSVQEYAFAALCEASERALLHSGKTELLLCGGNARNKRLQEMMRKVAKSQKARFCISSDKFLGDNAAMIAVAGVSIQKANAVSKELLPFQNLRVESEKAFW
ncbi:MAG: tRNA (adenosine(37)-N6)-threonylcarbamoyltransferase complex transferase subunit TsaD [Candidatus Micrarchaeia archaeon]